MMYLNMEELRGTLLPFVLDYLKHLKHWGEISNSQLVLRVLKTTPLTLTDGFYCVEAEGVNCFSNSFIKVQQWNVKVSLLSIKFIVHDYSVLGHETMSETNFKKLKDSAEVKALIVPTFRMQLQSEIPEKSLEEIRQQAREVEELLV